MIKGIFDGHKILIGDKEINISKSQKIRNHSQDFSWSYGGSGPAQTALAILLEITNSELLSLSLYQNFKWEKIATLSPIDFVMPVSEVKEWVEKNRFKGVVKIMLPTDLKKEGTDG